MSRSEPISTCRQVTGRKGLHLLTHCKRPARPICHRPDKHSAWFRTFALMLAVVVLTGCRSSREATTGTYLTSKVRVTLPTGSDGSISVSGTLRMVGGERVQLSLLMPVLRSEVVRIEVNPDGLMVVSRMTKQYLQASRQELSPYLPRRADFAHLQKLLLKAADKEEVTFSAADLGIPRLEKCRFTLSNFSRKPISLSPTTVSDRYERMELDELLQLLGSLVQ